MFNLKKKLTTFVLCVMSVLFSFYSFGYELTNADNKIVDIMTEKIENVFAKKNENFKQDIIRILPLLSKKYEIKNPRLSKILTKITRNITLQEKNNEQSKTRKRKTREKVETNIKAEMYNGNEFALNLYKLILEEKGNKNSFVSPTSIALALGMTYNGSETETKKEFENVLFANNKNRDLNNKSLKSLSNHLKSFKDIELNIANSLWISPTFEVKDKFIKINKETFNSEVKNELNADKINNRVAKNTNDKIKKVIDEIDGDVKMILVNTIYFLGDWLYEFENDDSWDETFNFADGTQKELPMMHKTMHNFQYYEDEKTQVIELPYKNKDASMVVFLPKKDLTVSSLTKSFSKEGLSKYFAGLEKNFISLTLPKFKMRDSFELKTYLESIGLSEAFTNTADFSLMGTPALNIGEVIHKTYIDVDEKGTEAAAVTVVEMVMTGMPDLNAPKPIIMKVDRPFFFVIKENKDDNILFMGTVYNPEQE